MLEPWNRAGLPADIAPCHLAPTSPARGAAVLVIVAIVAGRAHAVRPFAAGSIVARCPVAPGSIVARCAVVRCAVVLATVEHAPTLLPADGAPEECAEYRPPCGAGDTWQAAMAAHAAL